MDRGAGGLQSMGSQRVGHDWSDLACIHVLWIVIFLVPHWSFAPLSIFEYFYQIFRPLSIASISIFIIFLIDLVLSVIDWSWKRKSRNTWSNSQIWHWSTEWSRAKAHRVLPRERTGHSKHPLPTTQEKTLHMDITRWSTLKSDWLYSLQPKMEKLIQSAKTRPGADCGSDHELLIAEFRLKLKKVEKPLDHSSMI